MSEEFRSKLVITSQTVTPSEINNVLGMICDESYVMGEIRGHTIIRQKENAWIVRSRKPKNLPLQEHIADLLERISPIIDRVKTVSNQPDVEVEFGCTIYTNDRPALFFTKEQVAAIYQMGASIDVDLYLIPDDNKST